MSLLVLIMAWSLCSRGAAAEKEKSPEPFLRLVDGSSRCQGRLQVQLPGQDWAEVAVPYYTHLWFGNRMCSELDCGSVVSLGFTTVPVRSAVSFSHDCYNSDLIDCFMTYKDQSTRATQLNCSDSVRLVGGRSQCSGSLQIQDQSLGQSLNQSWAGVCEGALDRRGAEVLCRELGCGAPLLQGALSPLGQTFHCEGHESKLVDCKRTRTGPETCPTLSLTCKEPLRLVGGASRCEGILEAKHEGQWGRMITSDPYDHEGLRPGDPNLAAAVCRYLDCGPLFYTAEADFSKLGKAWIVSPWCMKYGAVRHCILSDYESVYRSVRVVCSDSVRLVGGRSQCSGSLQIQDQSLDQSLGQSWAGVCEGALDRRGAEVLCRELGCGAPLLQGALSPLGQTFHCEGHESKLRDCNRTRTGPETCPTLSLTCAEPVRLVGGASRCEGTVEVKHQGQWGPVWPDGGYGHVLWEIRAASIVCGILDCGRAIALERRSRNVWSVDTDCVRANAGVRDCVMDGDGPPVSTLFIICSGLQGASEDTESPP